MRQYSYNLGFAINGTPIPDPHGFSGSTSDLDTSAERGVDGYLHRNWVARKISTELQYKNISWDKLQEISTLMNTPQFSFTFPDPNTGTNRTTTCYAGDRNWTAVWLPTDGEWIADLTVSIIEY